MSLCSKLGPGSPHFQHNAFTNWIASRTIHSNSKSLYYQFLYQKFGDEQSTAINKLAKAGLRGKIDNVRVGRGLARGLKAFNSAKAERATIELSLCAMRNSIDIARIDNSQPKPCFSCGTFEKSKSNSPRSGFLKHLLLECSPSVFLSQYLKLLMVKTLGFSFKIDLGLMLLNEIPYDKCKTLNDDKKKTFFTILNCFKTTLYSIYYLRPSFINENLLLTKFKYNLKVACEIAKERGSSLMQDIHLPSASFCTFQSLKSIRKQTMLDTQELRHSDNNNRRLSYLQNNAYGPQLNANLPRRRNATQKKAFSAPKRQILISEIFARIPNKKFTHDGNLELVNSANGNT